MSTFLHIVRLPFVRMIIGFVLAFATLVVIAILDILTGSFSGMILSRGVGALLAVGVMLLLEQAIEAVPLAEGGIAPRNALPDLGRGFLIGVGLMVAIFAVLSLAGWYRVDRVEINPLLLTESLLLFLVVGLFEELLFRGVLFRQIEGVLGSWASLVIGGVLFGAAHLANPSATIWSCLAITIGAGTLLSCAYLSTRTIWVAVGIHWAWNFFQGPIFGAPVSGIDTSRILVSTTAGPDLWTGGAFGPEAGLVALIATILTSLLLLRIALRRGHIHTPAWLRPRTLLVMLVLPLALAACSKAADTPTPRPAATKPTALIKPTVLTKPTAIAKPTTAPASADDTWLIMLYEDADDQVLEQDMFTDVNEAERVGSSDKVTIVAQVDRYKGAFRGDGNWTGARRLHITKDDDLKKLNSEVVSDLGEVNMADGQTLVDFAEWAITTYPAAHHALILSDHGMGWPGGWSDGSQTKPGPDGLGLTSNGDLLLLDEIDAALGTIRTDTGITSFDLIGFDACLMGQIEVLTAVAPHTRYVVASEEVEPALGWAYAGFLGKLVANPAMDGAALSKAIVDSYIDQDQRIVDDAARAEFVKETFDTTKTRSARAVATDMSHDVTLSAYDTAALPELLAALDDFSVALSKLNKKTVASARTYAQRFENTFDDGPSPYIDIGSFATLVRKKSNTKGIDKAADALLAALKRAVIAEKHGDERSGATGLSIYFPTSKLYKSADAGRKVYAQVANRFADQAAWENYLNFYYYGVALDTTAPTGNTLAILAPGASPLSVAKLKLSAKKIAQNGTVTVKTSVDGDQISFIYFFTGFYNPDDDSVLVADIDYVDAGQSRKENGIFYPDWGADRPVTLEYDWTPVRFGISDGTTTKFALFAPSDYGAANDSATYVVHGNYTFVDGGTRQAQLFFKDNALIKVLGFSSQGQASAPRVITPQPGDTFTVTNQRIRLHSNSGGVKEYVTEAGDTLTFGDQPFTMEELPAPAGSYVLGVQAEDMDGNLYDAYTNVTVRQ